MKPFLQFFLHYFLQKKPLNKTINTLNIAWLAKFFILHVNRKLWQGLLFKQILELAQRGCGNVVTTSRLTLSQRCGKLGNKSCGDVSFHRCDNIVARRCQDVATTLLQCRYNINQWLRRCFLITDNCQFFQAIET